ncbi:aminopeptidase [Artemisia annua]|uniref:Aminopeptidase n=1 Tax=Artemisia annua TaxID=35608 RepID=A0A2U1NUL1_ARTAN|nr:aminopeptidase [Artemisia annua]
MEPFYQSILWTLVLREFIFTWISFAAKDVELVEWKGDILAVGVTEKDMTKDENSKFQNSILKKIDSQLNGLLSEVSKEEDFTGKTGQSTVPRLPGLRTKRVGLVGLEDLTVELKLSTASEIATGRRYLFGDTDWFDGVHCDVFSMDLLGEMLEDLGYTDRTLLFTHFRIPDESLDDGLLPLMSEEDVRRLVEYVRIFTQLELYIETGVSAVECEMMERMMTKGKGVVIEEIVDHDVNDNVGKDVDGETGNTGKLLLLEWHKTSQPEKAGPLYDNDSNNGFPPTFCAEKMIANHSKRLRRDSNSLSNNCSFSILNLTFSENVLGSISSVAITLVSSGDGTKLALTSLFRHS